MTTWRRFLFTPTTISLLFAILASAGPIEGASWTPLFPTASPEARYGHSMTTVGRDVYIFGGINLQGTTLNDLWVWDRDLVTWVEVAPASGLPDSRFAHGSASVHDRLYVAFGLNAGGVLDDLWEYDPETNLWTELSIPGPGARRYGGMAAISSSQLVIAGGYSDVAGTMAALDAWILDPVLGTSQQIANLPAGRIGFAIGAHGGSPVIIGGLLFASATIVNDVLTWNPDPPPLGTWDTTVPGGATPLGRVHAAAIQVLQEPAEGSGWGEDILILGGEGSGSKNPGIPTPTASTQIFDLVANLWSHGLDMPVGLTGTAGAILPPAGGGAATAPLEVLVFGGQELVTIVLLPTDDTYLYTSDIDLPQSLIFKDDLEDGTLDAWSGSATK